MASAQTLSDRLASTTQKAQGDKDKLLVEAGEIIYNDDNQTVSAVGDVHLYYQGRTLQADEVIYDRKNKRVFAKGNARMTEADGSIITGDQFELTDDFKDGFMDSLRVKRTEDYHGQKVTTRFSAPRLKIEKKFSAVLLCLKPPVVTYSLALWFTVLCPLNSRPTLV